MADTELEGFKIEIDLVEYAASLGFEVNRRDSWRGSAVMERGKQDKIIITRDTDGHYIYFLVKDKSQRHGHRSRKTVCQPELRGGDGLMFVLS